MGYFSFQLKAFLEGNSALLQSVKLMSRHYLMTLIMSLLLPGISLCQDTLICDNGGFEDGFTYYYGSYATYYNGGNSCSPLDGSNNPSVWSSISIPASDRFVIVNSGTDPLVGIPMTKFGNKAARLNNFLGHISNQCSGHRDANKLIKRFKVTAEHREFSIWYATVLEFPSGHNDSQPFFSISCDLAPNYDLCFDASDLKCANKYGHECEFDSIQIVPWTCHRMIIPASEIGNIATIEIIASDCGCAAHFGYAYVDGFCEECDGSALGTAKLYDHPIDTNGLGIDFEPCDTIISICGDYELPTICGTWRLDSIRIPGFSVLSLLIDTSQKIFCFEISNNELDKEHCADLNAILYFSSVNAQLPPVVTNSILLCYDDYATFDIDFTVGSCQNNNTTNFASDDYYYVQVDITNTFNNQFIISRQLEDPYPNESGLYTILSDTGRGIFNLGPFFIQDGSWDLIIQYSVNCGDTVHITPPNYCSGCNTFRGAQIFDVSCGQNNTWSYKIYVPGQGNNTYTINGNGSYAFNTTHTISGLTQSSDCQQVILSFGLNCTADFRICPPKPCNVSCDIEAYILDLYCDEEDNEYYVTLAIESSNALCVKIKNIVTSTSVCTSLPNGPLGPFDEDVEITILVGNTSNCNCSNPSCYKTIFVPFPDCGNLDYRTGQDRDKVEKGKELEVIPNPINGDVFKLRSSLQKTEYTILDRIGTTISSGTFESEYHEINLSIRAGLYFVRYLDTNGQVKIVKFTKF